MGWLIDLSHDEWQPEIIRAYCPIHALLPNQTADSANGTGVPLVTYVAILSEGLIDVEYQQAWTGVCNPVTYGVRSDRRNSPGRWQRHRSFGQIQAPPSSSPPCPPHRQSCRWRLAR